jgi:hypothetical protein
VSVPIVALPIVAKLAKRSWKLAIRALKKFANWPLVVVVPVKVDDAAVMPLVTFREVAVAFATVMLPPLIVPEVKRFVVVAFWARR